MLLHLNRYIYWKEKIHKYVGYYRYIDKICNDRLNLKIKEEKVHPIIIILLILIKFK